MATLSENASNANEIGNNVELERAGSGSSLSWDHTPVPDTIAPPPQINTSALEGQRMSNYSTMTNVEIIQPDIYRPAISGSSSSICPRRPANSNSNPSFNQGTAENFIQGINQSTDQTVRRRLVRNRKSTNSYNNNSNKIIANNEGSVLPSTTGAELLSISGDNGVAERAQDLLQEFSTTDNFQRETRADTGIVRTIESTTNNVRTPSTKNTPVRTSSMNAPKRQLSRIRDTPVERRVDFTSRSELKKFNRDRKFVFHRGFLRRTLDRFRRNARTDRTSSGLSSHRGYLNETNRPYNYDIDSMTLPSSLSSRPNTPNSKKFRTHKQLQSVMEYIDLQSMDIGEQIPVPLEFVYGAQNLYLIHNTRVGPRFHRLGNNQRLEQARSVVVPLSSIPRQSYNTPQLRRQLSRSNSIRRKMAVPRPPLASTAVSRTAVATSVSDLPSPASSPEQQQETKIYDASASASTRTSSLRRRNTGRRTRSLRRKTSKRSNAGSSEEGLPMLMQRLAEREEIQRLWGQFMKLIIWRRIRLRLMLLNASSISSLSSTFRSLE